MALCSYALISFQLSHKVCIYNSSVSACSTPLSAPLQVHSLVAAGSAQPSGLLHSLKMQCGILIDGKVERTMRPERDTESHCCSGSLEKLCPAWPCGEEGGVPKVVLTSDRFELWKMLIIEGIGRMRIVDTVVSLNEDYCLVIIVATD